MLNPRQRKCVELLASGEHTQREIAKQLHVSENTVCNWKKNEEFKAEYESTLRRNMRDAAAKAFQTVTNLLKARSEMVRLLAAKDILDRARFKPEDNGSIASPNADTELVIKFDYGDAAENLDTEAG